MHRTDFIDPCFLLAAGWDQNSSRVESLSPVRRVQEASKANKLYQQRRPCSRACSRNRLAIFSHSVEGAVVVRRSDSRDGASSISSHFRIHKSIALKRIAGGILYRDI